MRYPANGLPSLYLPSGLEDGLSLSSLSVQMAEDLDRRGDEYEFCFYCGLKHRFSTSAHVPNAYPAATTTKPVTFDQTGKSGDHPKR